MSENVKENYSIMFTNYPDIVNIEQMRKMLGGIGVTLAYKLLKQRKIKSMKIGREYKIPKSCIIQYLLDEQNQNKTLGLSLLSPSDTNNKTEQLKLSNQPLSSEEELIITKCLSAWYNISKEEMVNSLLSIIKENPNTNLIKRIITDLVNKLSDDPREQRLKKMGHYRDMLLSDYIKEWLNSIQNQVVKSTYKGYYDHVNGRMIPYFENEKFA